MTNKELIKILKRFPKNATVIFDDSLTMDFVAGVDNEGNWQIKIKPINEKVSCNNAETAV